MPKKLINFSFSGGGGSFLLSFFFTGKPFSRDRFRVATNLECRESPFVGEKPIPLR